MMRQNACLDKLFDDWMFFIGLPWHHISQQRERTFPTDYMKKQNLEPLLSLKYKAPLFWWLSAPWVSDPIPSLWDGVFHITRKTWTKNPTLKTKVLTWKTLKTNCENSRVPSRDWVSELASGSRWCKRDFKHEAKTIYTSFTFHKIVPSLTKSPTPIANQKWCFLTLFKRSLTTSFWTYMYCKKNLHFWASK